MVYCSNLADCQDFSDANTCTAPNSKWCNNFNALPEIVRESSPCAESVQRCKPDAYAPTGDYNAVEQCIGGKWVTIANVHCGTGGNSNHANLLRDMSRLIDLGNAPIKVGNYPEPKLWGAAVLYGGQQSISCQKINPNCDESVMSCLTTCDFEAFPSVPIPEPISVPIPVVQGELYDIKIWTSAGHLLPDVPSWLVDKIRGFAFPRGWLISGIHKTDGAYLIQAERVGSISLGVLILGIIALLAVIAGVIGWTATRLSDNKILSEQNITQQEQLQFCTIFPEHSLCKEPIMPPKPPEENGIMAKVEGLIPIFIGLAVLGTLASFTRS